MSYIDEIDPADARGLLRRIFDRTLERAGRIWGITRVMSLNPRTLDASMRFYGTVMFGTPPLTRVQREMLAAVTADANDCSYWTQAHAHDLREEVSEQFDSDSDADAFVHALVDDWRSANLSESDRALCEFALKLTTRQTSIDPADVDHLRSHGFDDRAIHDAVQVVAHFNYITRVADGLGVEPESFIRRWGTE